MKNVITIILLFTVNRFLYPQDASYYMLPHTPVTPEATDFVPLPQQHYIHPNTGTRTVHFPGVSFVLPPNTRVHPSNNRQTETVIVRHWLNQNLMFASANTQSPTVFEGVYVTTDSGINWFGSDTIMGLPLNSHQGDPGIVIDKNGVFILVHIGGGSVPGMASNYSTDYGLTWSNSIQIESGNLLQHEASAGTDDVPTSSFFGSSFATYTNVTAPARRVQFVNTDNGAQTWTTPVTISPVSASGRYQAWSDCPARTGPNGQIYVIWNNYINTGSIPDSIGFAKSTDGGATWVIAINTAFDINGLPTGSTINGMRYFHFPRVDVDRSGGPRTGWIYVVTNERFTAPATDIADIILHRSSDGGNTWSAGIRVNQDTPANGKYQVFPAIRVDESGAVNIVYYDSRNIPTNDSVEVFVSRSTDGGNTWIEVIASDHKSRPKSGYQGDYIGITSGNGKVFPFWMDDYSGIQQAWTVGVSILTGIAEKNTVPNDFSLAQNYPNPFNSKSKIKYQISKTGRAKLTVFDISGREIATLVNNELEPGTYEVTWNAAKFSSGVYFYSLTAGSFTATRKMVLIR